MEHRPDMDSDQPQNGLTPIHMRIHCAATPDTVDGGNELDQIDIDHFLDTLAEVAMAIVRRRQLLDR